MSVLEWILYPIIGLTIIGFWIYFGFIRKKHEKKEDNEE